MDNNLSYLSNLIALIYQDGKLDRKEFALISEIAGKMGYEDSEVIKLLNEEAEFEFIVPETFEEKVEQMTEYTKMIKADGRLTSKEIELLNSIGEKFGMTKEMINTIMDSI